MVSSQPSWDCWGGRKGNRERISEGSGLEAGPKGQAEQGVIFMPSPLPCTFSYLQIGHPGAAAGVGAPLDPADTLGAHFYPSAPEQTVGGAGAGLDGQAVD